MTREEVAKKSHYSNTAAAAAGNAVVHSVADSDCDSDGDSVAVDAVAVVHR